MVLDSKNGKEFLRAIVAANEMDVKFIHKTGSIVESIKGDEYASIKRLVNLIVENDSWAYLFDTTWDIQTWDDIINSNYPITIEK